MGQSEIETGGVASDEILNGSIVDIDIAPGAAINGTKISPNFGAQNMTTTGDITANSFISATTVYPDYVFQKYFLGNSLLNPNYEFSSLKKVETFLEKNHHLPGIKSAKEIESQDGKWNVTEGAIKNLEKIEELFLHTIEQEKKIQSLKEENKKLIGEVVAMKKEMELIKKMLSQKSNTQWKELPL